MEEHSAVSAQRLAASRKMVEALDMLVLGRGQKKRVSTGDMAPRLASGLTEERKDGGPEGNPAMLLPEMNLCPQNLKATPQIKAWLTGCVIQQKTLVHPCCERGPHPSPILTLGPQ